MMLLVTGVIALVKAVIQANNKITALAKGLGVSKNEARAINRNINQVAKSSDNMLNTTKEIGKAFADINTFLGTSSTVINGELMDGVATLQNRMGLSKEAAMGFMQASLLSGEKINDMKLEALGVSNAVSATYGTRLDDKAVLEEAAKTTGVIRAQSGGNLDILVKSVATAKSFGISLKEVANAGRQLLNFEQSISAELEAELLTGKQLNLERARLAALTGDYETVTKEIMKNVGGINDFMSLNVLQQEALAKSVGMEANQLSDVLLKKQNIEELAEEARKGGNEDLARQYEQLSTQQKFNAAIEKLKDFVVILVDRLESGTSVFGALFKGFDVTDKDSAEKAAEDRRKNERITSNTAGGAVTNEQLENIFSNMTVQTTVVSNQFDLSNQNNYNGKNTGDIRFRNNQK